MEDTPCDNGTLYDLAIVGAGPIGIELAVASRKAGLNIAHFDARQIGHTVSWFAPQTRWFSSNDRIAIANVPLVTYDGNKATREQYLAYLRSIVSQFDLTIRTFEPVIKLQRRDGHFLLTSQRGNSDPSPAIPRPSRAEKSPDVDSNLDGPNVDRTKLLTTRAKSVVLATGGTERPRRLNIPGEDLPHVTAYFTDPHQYFRKKLLIIGGRNSAAEAALRCHHAGADVALSYRGASLPQKSIKYWLLPELEGLIREGKIRAEYNTVPTEITPTSAKLARGDEVVDIATDFVLKLIGYEADTTLFAQVGAQLIPGSLAPVFNPETMETTLHNLFVAGTAAGGTQKSYELFLENCHVHVDRILATLTGERKSLPTPTFAQPES